MSHRNEQVAQELLKAFAIIIPEYLNPEQYGMVTVTDVVVTTGLEQATLFISSLQHGRGAAKELNQKIPQMLKDVHRIVRLRKIPKLTFEFDISNERSDQIDQLLEEQE